MEKPFNATFFATVAVILPVIFLALALQSDYIARTFVASRHFDRTSKRQLRDARSRKSKVGSAASFTTFYFAFALPVVAVIVMFDGIYGEILSLLALEQRQAMLSTQSSVMQSAVVLIAAAGAASVWRAIEVFRNAETRSAVNNGRGDPPESSPPSVDNAQRESAAPGSVGATSG